MNLEIEGKGLPYRVTREGATVWEGTYRECEAYVAGWSRKGIRPSPVSDKVLEFLSDGEEHPLEEIAEGVGMPNHSVAMTLRRLARKDLVERIGWARYVATNSGRENGTTS